MPELVGLAAQGKPVICRHYLSVRADGAENHKMRAGALRADLGYFRRPEAARKGKLKFVGHLLVAKDQNGMLLEGSTRRRISGIVCGDIRKRRVAHLRAESWTQRDDVHWQSPPCCYCAQLYGKAVRPATIWGELNFIYSGLPFSQRLQELGYSARIWCGPAADQPPRCGVCR